MVNITVAGKWGMLMVNYQHLDKDGPSFLEKGADSLHGVVDGKTLSLPEGTVFLQVQCWLRGTPFGEP